MSSVYPAIPDPTPTVESLAETVRVMKVAVDLLTGQRTGGTAAHTFTQETTPTALTTGDLWIVPSTGAVSYWDGSGWLVVNPTSAASTATTNSAETSTTSVPAFSAYASASQSINNAWVKLQCNVAEFDTNNEYNTSLYRFNPDVAGLYLFTVAMQSSNISSFINFSTAVYKNGVVARQMAAGSYLSGPVGSAIVWMNGTTDYVEPYGFANASVTILAGSSNTYFQGCLLRPY